MVSSFEEGHSGKDKSDAMDRAEQAKPGITKSLMQMSAMTVMRRHFPGEAMPLEDVLSNEDAFSITTQLTDLRLQKLWCGGSLVYEGARNEGSLAIAELNQEWKRHQLSPFDDIEFRIPFADIRAFAEEAGVRNLGRCRMFIVRLTTLSSVWRGPCCLFWIARTWRVRCFLNRSNSQLWFISRRPMAGFIFPMSARARFL